MSNSGVQALGQISGSCLCHVGATGNEISADSTSFQVPNVGTFVHARACVILRSLDSGPRPTSLPFTVNRCKKLHCFSTTSLWLREPTWITLTLNSKFQFLLARFWYHYTFWKNIKFIVVHPSHCKSNAFSIRNIGLASAGSKIGSGKAPVEPKVSNPKSGQVDKLVTR